MLRGGGLLIVFLAMGSLALAVIWVIKGILDKTA